MKIKRGMLVTVRCIVCVLMILFFQVAPAYLESVLLSHDQVVDAAVVGTPHDVHGHLPTAYVVCNEPISKQKIADYVNGRLTRWSVMHTPV